MMTPKLLPPQIFAGDHPYASTGEERDIDIDQ